jgi:molybdenum cofactor biosynthesis enzyme MoaA
MTTFNLEPQYLFTLASMPRGFNTKQSIGNKCNVPSKNISIDYLGNCFLCECDGWLPLPVGKVLDFASISEVLLSPQAKLLQSDVSEGLFSWCAVDHCGIRTGDRIKHVLELAINIDESCNLYCPSCRRDPVMQTQGTEYEKKLENIKRITQWLERWNDRIHIIMSGNGDPLASHVIRHLLLNFVPQPLHTFTLKTNGLLIKKLLGKLPIINHITNFSISVDAGSESVYEDVRRPAKWNMLIENLEFLQDIGKNSITGLNFALQNKNYKDVPAFVDLCQKFGFAANIHQLDDWGTWSIIEPEIKDTWTIKNGTFNQQDILSSTHINHLEAKNIIQSYVTHKKVQISPMVLSKFGIGHL